MKILYITHLHPPENQPLENVGGMQSVSIQMVDVLKRRTDVELETIILRAPWAWIGFYTTIFLFRLLRLIPRKVDEFKPDVILFSSMVTAGVVPFLNRRISVPKVTINHGQDVTLPVTVYQKYLPKVFRYLDGVISVSEATRAASIERGMDPDKGVALPNGFIVKKSRPDKKHALETLKKDLNIDFDKRRLLLTVGRLVKRKGHAWFIKEVMPLIKTDVNYLVIGDGPEFDDINNEVLNSPCRDRIILAGKQPNNVLNHSYAASDLFIMPNIPVEGDMEGFGIVLLEANRAGVPAIASDLEGIRDVIEQGVNGYRVPHSKPEAFAGMIDKVLSEDLEKFSLTSSQFVERNFSWDSVVTRYLDFLENIIIKKQG